MTENDPGLLERIGMKVGDLIGRYLPEPDKEKGGHALNAAIIGVIVFTAITLLVEGIIAAAFEFVVLAAYVILGMYAGGPVFLRLREKKNPPAPPSGGSGPTPPPAGPDSRRRRGGNPFATGN